MIADAIQTAPVNRHDFTPGALIWNTKHVARKVLSAEDLQRAVPSAFAVAAKSDVSHRYTFIPTTEVIRSLTGNGWVPVAANEQRVRLEDKRGFTKHVIRFEREGQEVLRVGDTRLQLVLTNSHDRSCGYLIDAGVWRAACSNGLIVSQGVIDRISLKHVGLELAEVLSASNSLIEQAPKVEASITGMQARILTPVEARALAEGALILRYDEPEKAPVKAIDLLQPKRAADDGDDLWRTFNRVQENIIKGGQLGFVRTEGRFRRAKSRQITSLNEDSRINRALWKMAEILRAGGAQSDINAATGN